MHNQVKSALKKHYGIAAKECEQLRGYYDSNFRIYDGKKKYFVKIFGFDKEDSIAFQIDFINACHKANVPVAEVLKTKAGEQQIILGGKPLIVQHFLRGKSLINVLHTDDLTENIGEILGKIHVVSSQQAFGGRKWKEYDWDLAQFHLVVDDFKKTKPYLSEERIELVNAVVNDWKLKANQFRNLRKGVIHNDFQGLNLLVENNCCTGVIDFGDALESWFAADIAIALMHICLSQDRPFALTRRFLQGYQKHFDLTDNAQLLLPLLCKMRATTIIINQKKDFKENIPKDYQKIFNGAVKVLKLLTEKDNENELKRVIEEACRR